MSRKFLVPPNIPSGPVDPAGGVAGDLFYNTVDGVKVHNGTSWEIIGEQQDPAVFIQDTQPVTSATKYLWWDTSDGDLTLWIEDGS